MRRPQARRLQEAGTLVRLPPRQDCAGEAGLPCLAVQVRDAQPPAGAKPFEWMLACSEGSAERAVLWYQTR